MYRQSSISANLFKMRSNCKHRESLQKHNATFNPFSNVSYHMTLQVVPHPYFHIELIKKKRDWKNYTRGNYYFGGKGISPYLFYSDYSFTEPISDWSVFSTILLYSQTISTKNNLKYTEHITFFTALYLKYTG